MKYFITTICILIIGLCIFSSTPYGYEFFGKVYTNAGYNIYKQNHMYRDGKIEHIKRLQFEQQKSTDATTKEAYQQMIDSENSTLR